MGNKNDIMVVNLIFASIIVLILLIIIYPHKLVAITWPAGEYLNSPIDNREYRAISYFHNPDEAVDKLANVNNFNESLISYFGNKCNHNECNQHQERMLYNLQTRYDPNALIENDPSTPHNTSYTQFKGKIFAVCLREKDTGRHDFEDYNTLKFVSLHELSHVSADSYGHNDEFWLNFKTLLHLAKESNLYKPIDYSVHPLRYCGVDVYTNPYYWN